MNPDKNCIKFFFILPFYQYSVVIPRELRGLFGLPAHVIVDEGVKLLGGDPLVGVAISLPFQPLH